MLSASKHTRLANTVHADNKIKTWLEQKLGSLDRTQVRQLQSGDSHAALSDVNLSGHRCSDECGAALLE